MRFKNRVFALIWIVLSILLCCAFCDMYKSTLDNVGAVAIVHVSNSMLAVFFILMSLLAVVMGIFFFIFSDELQTYFQNYHRTKKI